MMVKAGQRVAPSLALHVATARGPAERAAPLQPQAAQPVAPLRERQGGWPLLPPGRCTAQAPAGDPGPRQGMRPACAGPPLVRVPARLPRASGTAGVQAPAGGAAPRPCPQRRRLHARGPAHARDLDASRPRLGMLAGQGGQQTRQGAGRLTLPCRGLQTVWRGPHAGAPVGTQGGAHVRGNDASVAQRLVTGCPVGPALCASRGWPTAMRCSWQAMVRTRRDIAQEEPSQGIQ